MVKTLTPFITPIKIKKIIAIFAILFFSACNENERDVESDLLVIEKAAYSEVNNRYYVKIFFNDQRYKIYRAYFDCRQENRKVDTTTFRVADCEKQLQVKNDTIKISFVPTVLGSKKFQDITIVYRDIKGNINLLDTTFYYKVVLPNDTLNAARM